MLYECPACFTTDLKRPPYEIWPPPGDVDELTPPYEDSLGKATYEVCLACAYEFGFDDNPGSGTPMSFSQHRAKWIEDGRRPLREGRPYPEGSFCRFPSPLKTDGE